MSTKVFDEFVLPNGSRLSNRVVKAAMEENLSASGNLPDQALFNLYRSWSAGGAGALITGNVMVDRHAMTGPGGVALEAETKLEPFKQWASAAKEGGNQVWMQINHPGRQVYAAMGGKVLSPSDIALDMGKFSKLFGKPQPMTEAQIQDLIQRFATTASKAVEAGFDGVQVHAAHGYLVSQFLSPLTNQRDDQWGGSIENRARLLIEIVKAIRAKVPSNTTVSVKLNSADFQRGGFDAEDAKQVLAMLAPLGIDFVELSGGSYESPAMQGQTADGRTLQREAYFLKFVEELAKSSTLPIMTTGGISRLPVAQTVLDAGVDLVGVGRGLAFSPNLVQLWQSDEQATAPIPDVAWKDKTMSAMAVMAVTKDQLRRLSKGGDVKPNVSPLLSLLADQWRLKSLTRRYRREFS